MSLFVGRIKRSISFKDIEEEFSKFGTLKQCSLREGKNESVDNYAFIAFEDESSAERAIEALHQKEFRDTGTELNVEWSKFSGRNERRPYIKDGDYRRNDRRRYSRSRSRGRRRRRRSYSRSRSRSRDRYSSRRRSRSHSRDRHSSRRRSNSRSRSRGRDDRRSYSRERR